MQPLRRWTSQEANHPDPVVRPPFIISRGVIESGLNERLKSRLLTLSGSEPDIVSNTSSGKPFFERKWLSKNNLHRRNITDFDEIAGRIEETANKVTPYPQPLELVSMWAVVSHFGMAGRRHMHSGKVSIAYYVDPGFSGDSAGGQLCFYADRSDRSRLTHTVVPEAGMLVMFPSHLFHSVTRYESESPRIVISANLEQSETRQASRMSDERQRQPRPERDHGD